MKIKKISPAKLAMCCICPFLLEVKLIKKWCYAVKRWDEKKRGTN